MATEVALSFSTLRSQLENEKSNLQKIDETLKKVVQSPGRFQNDRFNKGANNDFQRGQNRLGNTRSAPFPDNDRQNKRKHEAKTVFSRLSIREEDHSDGEEQVKKPRLSSQVIRDLPSKQEVLKVQCGDEKSKNRNRRMFGSLLGTLQKFKQEELILKNKEEKKAQIENKIEEQAKLELENRKRERQHLFAERDAKKASIKALETKMSRLEAFELWETTQKHLSNFILTKAKPHIYWLPKSMTEKANEKLEHSRKYNQKKCEKKKQEMQMDLQNIEHKFNINTSQQSENEGQDDSESPKKREKFSKDPNAQDDNASVGSESPTHKNGEVSHDDEQNADISNNETTENQSELPDEPTINESPEKMDEVNNIEEQMNDDNQSSMIEMENQDD